MEENSFVHTLIGSGNAWIGYNDQDMEGTFVRSRTGDAGTFSNWSSGAPNMNGEEENCVVLNGTDWHDVACNATFQYICKMGQ